MTALAQNRTSTLHPNGVREFTVKTVNPREDIRLLSVVYRLEEMINEDYLADEEVRKKVEKALDDMRKKVDHLSILLG